MKYALFLFDADDTLFDYSSSEKKSLYKTLITFGFNSKIEDYYQTYKLESEKLWRQLELGKTTKEFLRVERFRRTLKIHGIHSNPKAMQNLTLGFMNIQ